MKQKNLPALIPQVFEYEQFGKLRVVRIDGVLWFIGIDVARALGYKKPRNAIAMHVDAEDKRPDALIRDVRSNGVTQNRKFTLINKSGVYSLILDSKLPKAKEYRHWVTSEILPQVDEMGSYSVPKSNKKKLPQLPPDIFNDNPTDFGNVARLEMFLEENGIEYDYDITVRVIKDENGKESLCYQIEPFIKG